MRAKFVNEFLNNSDIKSDIKTNLYLEGKITFKEWSLHINNLNESDIKEFFQEKIFSVFKSIIEYIKNKKTIAKEKIINVLKKIYEYTKAISKKYPALRKFIISLITCILLTIATGTISQAAVKDENPVSYEQPVDTTKKEISSEDLQGLNSIIGFIEMMKDELRKNGFDYFDILKAQASVIDIKDGKRDDPSLLTENTVLILKGALQTLSKMNKEGGVPKSIIELGEKMIKFTHNVVDTGMGSRESINIYSQ